jgi:hypothetical protein
VARVPSPGDDLVYVELLTILLRSARLCRHRCSNKGGSLRRSIRALLIGAALALAVGVR